MNKTRLAWTVANIERMHRDKEVLSFDHPIQRKSQIWSNSQKSLLIHSMLEGVINFVSLNFMP